MAKKATAESKDISSALGLGVEIDLFLDGKSRTAYPVTLKDYPDFVNAISTLDPENIANSFFADGGEGLRNAIAMSFGVDKVDGILENVDSNNYKDFIRKILSINGIELQDNNRKDNSKKK